MVAEQGCGVVVYVAAHEGRGIGLSAKIQAYKLQEVRLSPSLSLALSLSLSLSLPPSLSRARQRA